MNDQALHEALSSLVSDQPPAPDRMTAVRGRIRRRRQLAGAAVVALVTVASGAVVALLLGGPGQRAQPATASGFLTWQPRTTGHQGELDAAFASWSATQPAVATDLHPLYAGVPRGADGLVWTAFEARVAGVVRLVISRTTNAGPGVTGTLLVGDSVGPRQAFQVSAVHQTVTGGSTSVPPYVGKPGSTDQTTVFVLPAPGLDAVGLRALQGPRPVPAGIELAGPFVEHLTGVSQPVELSPGAEGTGWVRAGTPPALDVDGRPSTPEVFLPPIPVPSGHQRGGQTFGHANAPGFTYGFFLKGKPTRVLARCTSFGGQQLEVTAVTPVGTEVGHVDCDGAAHDVFGHDVESRAAGTTMFSYRGEAVDEVRLVADFLR